MNDVIELDCEETQWRVGLVRYHGRGGEQVLVVTDGAGVVKHDAAAEAVEVAHQTDQCESEGQLEEPKI